MVFGVLQLINFAHGDIVMVGAFVAYYLAKWTGAAASWPFALLALVVSMAVCAGLGFVIERLAYPPPRGPGRVPPPARPVAHPRPHPRHRHLAPPRKRRPARLRRRAAPAPLDPLPR